MLGGFLLDWKMLLFLFGFLLDLAGFRINGLTVRFAGQGQALDFHALLDPRDRIVRRYIEQRRGAITETDRAFLVENGRDVESEINSLRAALQLTDDQVLRHVGQKALRAIERFALGGNGAELTEQASPWTIIRITRDNAGRPAHELPALQDVAGSVDNALDRSLAAQFGNGQFLLQINFGLCHDFFPWVCNRAKLHRQILPREKFVCLVILCEIFFARVLQCLFFLEIIISRYKLNQGEKK